MDKKKVSKDDVKKKAAGFFGYIKHLVKDPVTTVPESKQRWKEVLRFFLISLAVTLVPAIISAVIMMVTKDFNNIIAKILNIPTMIGGVGVLFSLFLIFVLLKISSVLKLRECTKCKEQITYGDNVSYKIIKEWTDKQVTSSNNSTHVRSTDKVSVEIRCTCQKCGTPKQFTRDFRVAEYYDGSLKYSYRVDELVKGFFTGQHIQ